MDKKFLHKVVGQLIRETEIDRYHNISVSYFSPPLPFRTFLFPLLPGVPLSLLSSFYKHCRDVYGLNNDEVDYVWEEYRNSIIYLIKNG